MMRATTHVLMTRFNIATPGREAEIRTQPGWLEERFALFERFCLPSVAAQTSRDFTWIVYFDEDTPKVFRNRIEALRKAVPFVPFYTGLFPGEGWPRSVAETLGGAPAYLLSSRLDNDDALAVDYIERTRAAAEREIADLQEETLGASVPRIGIAITEGFIRSNTALYQISHPHNAFISWLEPGSTELSITRTAMGIAHMDAPRQGRLVQVTGPGGWLQVVHGRNVSNKVRGRRVEAPDQRDRFHKGALEGIEWSGRATMLAETLLLDPIRTGRDRLSAMAQSLRRR